MLRRAHHKPDGRNAVGNHYLKLVLGQLCWKTIVRLKMDVHVREAGDQEFAFAVDLLCALSVF